MQTVLLFMLLFPLIGSILNGLVLRPKYAKRSGVIASMSAGFSFLCALILWITFLKTKTPIQVGWEWFAIGNFKIAMGFTFDALTAVMAMVVTGIGTAIHIYSIGYMHEEKNPYRYFAYLNFFLFNMLVLITGQNLPVMFMGWEGVGLCSYLLIGYWYQDIQKANAGMKAFLVNRIGDGGFLIGIFLCFYLFNSVNFSDIIQFLTTNKTLDISLVNWATFFLFIGAMGKSAQIPLYVWLPDAMAGPTPVSALIHAATMVTAGIYMIVRLNPLFDLAESTRTFIAFTGVATALLAAFIAIAQRDIKKVLAYSTVSQLGLMFLSLGVGQYAAAVFHLMTHAFFKALLFLGSGSVIHGLHGEQDIFNMGGLKDKMPFTYLTFAIGTIAIAGIPPLSGFFSKDLILYGVLNSGHYGILLWVLGSLASFITSFYMTRLFILTFLGSYRGHEHPHESPVVMLFPLMILAVGSVLAGFLNMPHDFHLLPPYLDNFLSSVVHTHSHGQPILSEFAAMGIATTLAIVGMGLAWMIYGKGTAKATSMAESAKPVHNLILNKFWVDELYELIIVKPFRICSQFLAKFIDPKVIDGAVLLPAKISRNASEALSSLQEGSVQYYLLVFFAGFLFLFWYGLSSGLFGRSL